MNRMAKKYNNCQKIDAMSGDILAIRLFSNYPNFQRMKRESQKLLLLVTIAFALLFSDTLSLYAQDTNLVKGSVVDPAGNPVLNVSIGVEGSSDLPVFSNREGEFTIKVTPEDKWLNIEPSAEFKSRRVFLNKRENLKIYLSSNDLASGDDRIKIGNQEIVRRDIVASFSSISAEEAPQTGAITLDQYVQGRVPGLSVTNRSGLPGSGTFLMLNGPNSIYLSNEPLYIIDGVMLTSLGVFESILDGYEYNPLLALNVYDVSKVTIVKDPAITASYGSKASNGLITIETLDPSATQTLIELDLRLGIYQAPLKKIPQMNAPQHKTLLNEVLFSSGMFEENIRETYPNLFLTPDDARYIDYQHNTEWQSLTYDEAIFSNINLKVKGGDEIARYGLSVGYVNSEGTIKSTGYNGYNLRFVSRVNILTWLKMNANVSLNYSKSNLKESARVRQTSPVFSALSKAPMMNPFNYDIEGKELTTFSPVDEIGVSNPLAIIENFEASNSNLQILSTLGAKAAITKDLELNTNISLIYNILKELVFMPNLGMELYYVDEAINVSKASNNSLTSFNHNTFLNYGKQMGDHFISSSTGLQNQINSFEFDRALTKNASANDQYRNLNDGTANLREISGDNRDWNWLSIYQNINYSYLDRYLVSGSISLDGSTRVGDSALNTIKINNIPFGLFYGGGLGWRLSNESFLKRLAWLEELKLRVSYGKTGNDAFGESTATRYYNSIKYRGAVGLFPALVYNEELTYETVSKLTAGLDLALLGNRITAQVDLYSSETDNMLIYRELDTYFGYSFRPENGGKMKNRGIDLGLFFRIIDLPNFKWDIQGTLSAIENQVTEVAGGKNIVELMGAEIINKEGEQANSFYGYLYEGVYSTTGEAQNANLMNDRFIPFQAGDARFSDLSGPDGTPDGIINDYDKVVIGSSIPEFFGGINNQITYKRWTLSTFIHFVRGNELFNFVRYKNESMSGFENQSANVLNRWQYEGQITDVPRAKWEDPLGNSSFSTRWIEDGSYVRVKNISLVYSIDNPFFVFRNAKFYVSVNNAFTHSNYLGYDPEFAFSRSHIDQGIDYGLTPQTRQFIVGMKVGL